MIEQCREREDNVRSYLFVNQDYPDDVVEIGAIFAKDNGYSRNSFLTRKVNIPQLIAMLSSLTSKPLPMEMKIEVDVKNKKWKCKK